MKLSPLIFLLFTACPLVAKAADSVLSAENWLSPPAQKKSQAPRPQEEADSFQEAVSYGQNLGHYIFPEKDVRIEVMHENGEKGQRYGCRVGVYESKAKTPYDAREQGSAVAWDEKDPKRACFVAIEGLKKNYPRMWLEKTRRKKWH